MTITKKSPFHQKQFKLQCFQCSTGLDAEFEECISLKSFRTMEASWQYTIKFRCPVCKSEIEEQFTVKD